MEACAKSAGLSRFRTGIMAKASKKPAIKTGRPSLYRPEFVKQAEKLCALGATDSELADFFGVTVMTLNRWKISHPEFCSSIKVAKEAADARVERSLYNRATGYTFDSEKIMTVAQGGGVSSVERVKIKEHVPPDVTAQIFWLKNRRKLGCLVPEQLLQPGDGDGWTEWRAAS